MSELKRWVTQEIELYEPYIYRVKGFEGKRGFDVNMRFYDWLLRFKAYNSVIWGVTKDDTIKFLEELLGEKIDLLLDLGCGPMTYTYGLYKGIEQGVVVGVDISLSALRIARSRVYGSNLRREAVYFLQADIFDLPFEYGSADVVNVLGMLHLFESLDYLLANVYRVLREGGVGYFSVLVSDRYISKVAIDFLHFLGHLYKPRKADFYLEKLEDAGLAIQKYELRGGMLFVKVRK